MAGIGVNHRNGFGFVIAALLVLAASQVSGATRPETGLTKDQIAKIRAIGAELDAKIKPILAKDEKLSEAMRADLVQLSKLKSDAERRAAVSAYQKKFVKDYGGVLTKAGVDLNQIAKSLHVAIPGIAFRALPNLVIEGRVHTLATPRQLPGLAAKSRSTSPTFVDTKSLNCGAISGSDAVFTSSTIRNDTFAAVAGGCANDAAKTADLTPPTGATEVQLDASAKLVVSTFAAAVAGSAGGIATASLFALSGGSLLGDESLVSVTVLAPVLWSGYAEDLIDAAVVIGDVPLGGSDSSLRVFTSTLAVALLPSVATASANATQIDATLHSQF